MRLFISKPDEWINANQRTHWAVKARRVRSWRYATAVAARTSHTPPQELPVRITAHIWKTRGGRYDPNNLADTTKACIDGLIDAGVLPDDSHRELIGPDHRHGGKGAPGIELEIVSEATTANVAA